MAGDVQMDEGDPSLTMPDTMHPEQCHFTASDHNLNGDAHEMPTDTSTASGISLNDSGPSTPTHDEDWYRHTESTSPLILRPYAIEEPDEDTTSFDTRSEVRRLPDYFERWQRELEYSVNNLQSQSDTPTYGIRSSPTSRRGQKRKVAQPAGSTHQSVSSSAQLKKKHRLNDSAFPVPGLSPKRRRRLAGETDTKSAPATSLHEFRETQANDSSSSDQPTTDASGDTTNETPGEEEMDID